MRKRHEPLFSPIGEREYLYQGLVETGWLDPYPSQSNFLLARVRKRGVTVTDVQLRLEAKGILIRNARGFRGLGSKYVRFAVRRRGENQRLLAELRVMGRNLNLLRKRGQ